MRNPAYLVYLVGAIFFVFLSLNAFSANAHLGIWFLSSFGGIAITCVPIAFLMGVLAWAHEANPNWRWRFTPLAAFAGITLFATALGHMFPVWFEALGFIHLIVTIGPAIYVWQKNRSERIGSQSAGNT